MSTSPPKKPVYIKVTHERVPTAADLCPRLVPNVKHHGTAGDEPTRRGKSNQVGGATQFVVGEQVSGRAQDTASPALWGWGYSRSSKSQVQVREVDASLGDPV